MYNFLTHVHSILTWHEKHVYLYDAFSDEYSENKMYKIGHA